MTAARERVVLQVGGADASDVAAHLASLEVELSDEAPAGFRFTLALSRRPADGAWRWLDEERFRVWSRVSIRIGFGQVSPLPLVSGYVTAVRPRWESEPHRCTLEVEGMDTGVLMDREEKLKDWPGKRDSDIARELLAGYGLAPRVDETLVVHEQAMSTVIQRETDLQFLRRLAARNGFSCWVDGQAGHFGAVPADPVPQPVLAAHFGAQTTLARFSAHVDALRPAKVGMFQVDRFARQVVSAQAERGTRPPLGRLDADALLPGGVGPARVFVARNAATGLPEMSALCQGVFAEGSWFVTAEGETLPGAYTHLLKPRGLVAVKGVGETYSGLWYVQYVRHTLGRDGYTQRFRLLRDALLPTGIESFASPPSFDGLL